MLWGLNSTKIDCRMLQTRSITTSEQLICADKSCCGHSTQIESNHPPDSPPIFETNSLSSDLQSLETVNPTLKTGAATCPAPQPRWEFGSFFWTYLDALGGVAREHPLLFRGTIAMEISWDKYVVICQHVHAWAPQPRSGCKAPWWPPWCSSLEVPPKSPW